MPSFDTLCLLQAGVVTRRQCLEHGLTDEHVEARIGRRQWCQLERGVYVTHSGPLTYEARLWAAVLGVGGQVAIARESAIWWRNRKGFPPFDVHLTVPRGRHVAPRRGVVVRYDLRPWTALIPGLMPCTTAEDAVLDISAQARTVRDVEGAVCEAVRLRLTRPDDLAGALRLRPRHPRRDLLVDMFTEVEAGAQSPLELLDLRNDVAHGLPVALRQVRHRVGGRGRFLDATYTPPDGGRPVQKELDGRLGHEEAKGRFRDRKRDNAAVVRGHDPLRYGWHDLAEEGCAVAVEEITVMRRNGFGPVGHPCGPGCPVR